MKRFLLPISYAYALSAGLLLMTNTAQASSASDVKSWFSSIMGSHDLQGTNGENCHGIEIVDQGELIMLFPEQLNRPNGAYAQLSFFDDESKMNISSDTYTAAFTLGIEGGADQHELVTVTKNINRGLQSMSIQISTGVSFTKKILLKMNCVSNN